MDWKREIVRIFGVVDPNICRIFRAKLFKWDLDGGKKATDYYFLSVVFFFVAFVCVVNVMKSVLFESKPLMLWFKCPLEGDHLTSKTFIQLFFCCVNEWRKIAWRKRDTVFVCVCIFEDRSIVWFVAKC